MKIEYDEAKNQANIDKHGISFDIAANCDWDIADIRQDVRNNYGEMRYVAYVPLNQRLHHVTFTMRNGKMRIISFRKANKRERSDYGS